MIHGLGKRLEDKAGWLVTLKTLIVFHRLMREVDPSFQVSMHAGTKCTAWGHGRSAQAGAMVARGVGAQGGGLRLRKIGSILRGLATALGMCWSRFEQRS